MRWRSALACALLAVPAGALAHERWVPHANRPFERAYFRALAGQTLELTLLAALAIAGIVGVWYLAAVPLADHLALRTAELRAGEARRPAIVRLARGVLRFMVDGEVEGDWFRRGLIVASGLFARIPAFVLALGVVQGWLVMPSFPLQPGALGLVVRCAEALLAAWCLWGRWPRALGATLFGVFGWLVLAYGIAAIDAIPVLASAFFCYHAVPGQPINARQLAGVRLSLGIGFMLLGLVNKIWHAELFIGVGDNFPHLLDGPRAMFPGLTREAWSFGTALGEITFGALLLTGIFDKLTTLALAFIFANFVRVFGMAEIVHVYPISGFILLFFSAPPGTVLDGMLFRAHVGLWTRLRHPPGELAYRVAVVLLALGAGAALMLAPVWLFVRVIPSL